MYGVPPPPLVRKKPLIVSQQNFWRIPHIEDLAPAEGYLFAQTWYCVNP